MGELMRVEDVEKYYGAAGNMTKAVDRISFTVNRGEFVGIMGASGSGKTTLLNLLATVDSVTSGHIFYEGLDITGMKEDETADFRKDNLGFVFQDFNLLDTLTISENISLALSLCKKSHKEIKRETELIMEKLGIMELRDKFPYQVSGGQKQRCACARALVHKPRMILADEPTGALDSRAARMLMTTFTKMNEEMGATILMVTHDAFSASYCSRILFLRDGQIFHELRRGDYEKRIFDGTRAGIQKGVEEGQDPGRTSVIRREFLNEILDVLSLTGGEADA